MISFPAGGSGQGTRVRNPAGRDGWEESEQQRTQATQGKISRAACNSKPVGDAI